MDPLFSVASRRVACWPPRTASRVPAGADAAADCGYFDQAHMIAEFRALAGMTPTQYCPWLTEPYDPGLPG